ncbi:MAG: PEP-CTERM sorting domain-containing protein, partial [Planctomycetota bacterium]
VDVVQPATGLVSYTQGFGAGQLNPDGDGFTGSANMAPFGGISGYFGSTAGLVGVFLTDDIPAANPSAPLDFSGNGFGTEFTTLAPGLGQVFHIGNGQTTGGTLQSFQAPAGETRFAIGIADAFAARGNPGFYDDNDGGFEITLNIVPEPAAMSVFALGGLMFMRRGR